MSEREWLKQSTPDREAQTTDVYCLTVHLNFLKVPPSNTARFLGTR